MVHPARTSSSDVAKWRGGLLPVHRFTRDDFLAMIECGIIGPNDRVELIEGEVFAMSPSGAKHAEFVDRLVLLFANLHEQAQLRVQGTLALSERSVVDPDFMLLRRRSGGYAEALPIPADVLLLVEVADTTLLRDREIKAALYAEAGVPEYWIVNLAEQTIIVHRDPQNGRYDSINTIKHAGAIAPIHFPDKELRLDALFY